jgi:phage terminase large subunit-like protein
VLRSLYGTVAAENGLRQYRNGYVSVGKQNGKSFMFGGLPIYHLLMEDEVNPEAYGCAAAKDKAGLVFKSAAQLVKANQDLRSRLRMLESTKRILRRDGGGFYAVLAADGDVNDGIRPSISSSSRAFEGEAKLRSRRAESDGSNGTKGSLALD